MKSRLIWDETKRKQNLASRGLDFADAHWVLESHYRLDIPVIRNNETRIQSLAYVMNRLAVLTVVHLKREGMTRVISFRPASKKETEVYHEWLAKDVD